MRGRLEASRHREDAFGLLGIDIGPAHVDGFGAAGLRRGDDVRTGEDEEVAATRNVADVSSVLARRLLNVDVPVVAPAVYDDVANGRLGGAGRVGRGHVEQADDRSSTVPVLSQRGFGPLNGLMREFPGGVQPIGVRHHQVDLVLGRSGRRLTAGEIFLDGDRRHVGRWRLHQLHGHRGRLRGRGFGRQDILEPVHRFVGTVDGGLRRNRGHHWLGRNRNRRFDGRNLRLENRRFEGGRSRLRDLRGGFRHGFCRRHHGRLGGGLGQLGGAVERFHQVVFLHALKAFDAFATCHLDEFFFRPSVQRASGTHRAATPLRRYCGDSGTVWVASVRNRYRVPTRMAGRADPF